MRRIIYICDHCEKEVATLDLKVGYVEGRWLWPFGKYMEICDDCCYRITKMVSTLESKPKELIGEV